MNPSDYSNSEEESAPRVIRKNPNILITGTPGTGKTTTSELLALATGYKHINVSSLVKSNNLHQGYDQEFDTYVLDDDKMLDEIEPLCLSEEGGIIVDFHSCEVFPERWFDLVVVLRSDNTVLYDRLQKRGYNQTKLTENIECEIMQVVLDEARESYNPNIIVELTSNNVDEMEHNVDTIKEWAENFVNNRASQQTQ